MNARILEQYRTSQRQKDFDPAEPRAPAGTPIGGECISQGDDPGVPFFDGSSTWMLLSEALDDTARLWVTSWRDIDGITIDAQLALPASRESFDERYIVGIPDGPALTFTDTGTTQTVWDGRSRVQLETDWPSQGPQTTLVGGRAGDVLAYRLQQDPLESPIDLRAGVGRGGGLGMAVGATALEATSLGLFDKLSESNSPESAAVLIRQLKVSPVPGYDMFETTGARTLTQTELQDFCPKYPDVLTRADAAVERANAMEAVSGTRLSPQQYGIAVHTDIANGVKKLHDVDYVAELSVDAAGRSTSYGQEGSVRADIFERVHAPVTRACIYDIKTGNEGLTPARAAELSRAALGYFPNAKQLLFIEARPRIRRQ